MKSRSVVFVPRSLTHRTKLGEGWLLKQSIPKAYEYPGRAGHVVISEYGRIVSCIDKHDFKNRTIDIRNVSGNYHINDACGQDLSDFPQAELDGLIYDMLERLGKT
jgi:hypothetical protein